MKEKKNIEIFNRELLAKYLSNEVSSLEKLEVETWISQSAENWEELEQSRKMLANIDAFYKAKSFNSEIAWNNIKAKINPPQMKVIQRKNVGKEVLAQFYKYAAIIVFAVLLGSAGY